MKISLNNTRRVAVTLAVAFAFSLVFAGCSEKVKPGNVDVARGKSGPIRVMVAEPVEVPLTYTATGTVRAKVSATISPQVMGRVVEVYVREGQTVKAKDLLLSIDDSHVKAGVNAAEGMVEEARQALAEVEAAIGQAKSAKELAEKTYSRFSRLHEEKIISRQEYDEVKAKYEMAVKRYEMALARKEQVRAKLSQAEANLVRAKVMLGYTRVEAPFDGIVAKKFTDPGNLVSPGVPLFVIDREGTYRLEADLPEQFASRVKVGQKVEVSVESAGISRAHSVVAEVVPALDPATRTFIVKIDLPPNDSLRSGMFGRAVFRVGEAKGMFLPEEAVVRVGGYEGAFFVTDENVARFVMVKTGTRRDGRVEILSGIVPGQKVVVSGVDKLTDGDIVEISR